MTWPHSNPKWPSRMAKIVLLWLSFQKTSARWIYKLIVNKVETCTNRECLFVLVTLLTDCMSITSWLRSWWILHLSLRASWQLNSVWKLASNILTCYQRARTGKDMGPKSTLISRMVRKTYSLLSVNISIKPTRLCYHHIWKSMRAAPTNLP